jgi:DNA-binding MarR family transcriptional regulator
MTDTTDRRANLVSLTQKGIDLELKASAVIEEVAQHTLSILTEDELEMGKILLRKLYDHLA